MTSTFTHWLYPPVVKHCYACFTVKNAPYQTNFINILEFNQLTI